ncbi:NAD(P)/FAD-dependent oxidoreductase [Alicyclobacillus vulcanalis]|uniref:Ferredoxin--NADP reductase n=1 Tax=Alicyclobacillus vulcanalis TaxID=252246 RepID=A0A1N7JQF9_9BACL|nr:NAD(P)/FAD-dependent oxidoreductase [Alicyclobacillus vulcanalis]SIS51593.1 thioredoxin reductase (NADPH) [Alicyclobacillus vulcanalis]
MVNVCSPQRDLVIVGGGPAGLFAAFYAGLRDIRATLVEAEAQLGGKLRFYQEQVIWDLGGHLPAKGQDLLQQLVCQAQLFSPEILPQCTVKRVSRCPAGHFVVETQDHRTLVARSVLLATGSGLLRPRALSLPSGDVERAVNLHYTLSSPSRFRDRTVLVWGERETAVAWAHTLAPICRRVVLLPGRGACAHVDRGTAELTKRGVAVYEDAVLRDVIWNRTCSCRIEAVVIERGQESFRDVLRIDDVLVCQEFAHPDGPAVETDPPLAVDPDGRMVVSTEGETSVPGLFACGDAIDKPGKLPLLLGAFHDAAQSVNQIATYLAASAKRPSRAPLREASAVRRAEWLWGARSPRPSR